VFCAVAIVSALGLARRRWWSGPATIALALLVMIPGIRVWSGAVRAGVYSNRQAYDIALMTLPGFLYLATAVFCVYVAIRYVPRRKRRPRG